MGEISRKTNTFKLGSSPLQMRAWVAAVSTMVRAQSQHESPQLAALEKKG